MALGKGKEEERHMALGGGGGQGEEDEGGTWHWETLKYSSLISLRSTSARVTWHHKSLDGRHAWAVW
jgi:hypothetical protein